jgi:phage shock protein PspC (stress-responsive transcriptional regulator)
MKHYFRSYIDKKIFGVCGGLGRYTQTDPLIWRLLFVGLWFTPFPIFILYIVTTLLTKSIEFTD